jgi:hypothetical protein
MTISAQFRRVVVALLYIAAVESGKALSPEITSFLNDEENGVTEDGMLSNRPETSDFVRAVVADWQHTLQELPNIAPDTRRQSLLIVAGEFLPPKAYVVFVDTLCELRSKGLLTPEALQFVGWAGLEKRGFLAFNYHHSEVAAIVTKLEAQIMRDFPGEWGLYFAELKSGKMKEHIIERAEREGGSLPELYEGKSDGGVIVGSSGPDGESLTTRAIDGGTAHRSSNRSSWNMFVIVAICFLAIIGFVALLIRLKRS